MFSGYFKGHGLKVQMVFFPNGMIESVFITSMRNQENNTVNLSNLHTELLRLLLPRRLINGLFPAIYADGIFCMRLCIVPRFWRATDEQKITSTKISSMHVLIENAFADFFNLFTLFSMGHVRIRLLTGRYRVKKLFYVSFFVLNIYYSLNNTRSTMFNLDSLSLDEYLNNNIV